jgi:hypothetical protein
VRSVKEELRLFLSRGQAVRFAGFPEDNEVPALWREAVELTHAAALALARLREGRNPLAEGDAQTDISGHVVPGSYLEEAERWVRL